MLETVVTYAQTCLFVCRLRAGENLMNKVWHPLDDLDLIRTHQRCIGENTIPCKVLVQCLQFVTAHQI